MNLVDFYKVDMIPITYNMRLFYEIQIDVILGMELIWINMTSNDVFQKILRVLAWNHDLQYIICVNGITM